MERKKIDNPPGTKIVHLNSVFFNTPSVTSGGGDPGFLNLGKQFGLLNLQRPVPKFLQFKKGKWQLAT